MWEGRITNDTFFPLRSLGKSRSRRGRRAAPTDAKYAGGRWSLVDGLLDPSISDTERAHARVMTLLERYGLVEPRRGAVRGDSRRIQLHLSGASRDGRARTLASRPLRRGARGIAVRSRGGDRKASRSSRCSRRETRALLAVDPANPYGSILPWPETSHGGRPAARPRAPGSSSMKGELALYMEKGGRTLLTFGRVLRSPGRRAERSGDPDAISRGGVRTGFASLRSTTGPRSKVPSSTLLRELGFFAEASTMVYAEHPSSGPVITWPAWHIPMKS